MNYDIFENNPEFKELVHRFDKEGYRFDYYHFWMSSFPNIIQKRIKKFSDLMDYTYLYGYRKNKLLK